MPASGHEGEQPAEDSVDETSRVEHRAERVVVVILAMAFHGAEDPDHVHKHDRVEHRGENQEHSGNRGADVSADLLERSHMRLSPLGRQSQKQRHEEHDGRMAQREEESDAVRVPFQLDKLAHGIVDRRDMIRVERVAQAQRVGEHSQPKQHGSRSGRHEQHADAQNMQHHRSHIVRQSRLHDSSQTFH